MGEPLSEKARESVERQLEELRTAASGKTALVVLGARLSLMIFTSCAVPIHDFLSVAPLLDDLCTTQMHVYASALACTLIRHS